MKTKWWYYWSALLFLVSLVAGSVQPITTIAAPAQAESARPISQTEVLEKIDPKVLEQISKEGEAEFFIWMTASANLSRAQAFGSKSEKGLYVFETLRDTADRSQRALRATLDAQGVRYRPFYIANKIFIQAGNRALALALASRADVAHITPNHKYQLQEPFITPTNPEQVMTIEPNISFIRAPEVWALGITGQGTVLAGNDTGLDWDHPAIINHYRGWNGASADHNYNWWDATGTYTTIPGDGHGHGTHTTGTMIGSDGGANQIGVAPGARTIHCKNMTDGGSGDDYTFSICFEWDLAPWDLSGANPRPDLAPHAINNSWGYWDGGADQFEDEINALQAAGIVVEASAGNEGPNCTTLRSPGDYAQVLTTGSINHAGGVLPGTISGFSSRGPSWLHPSDFIPDVMAPGENIRSSVPGGGYEGGWNGTSMAGPHVTAMIGLMWSANPALQGLVDITYEIIEQTAVPLTGEEGSGCGGDYLDGPNNDWGFGTIDALAAVQAAMLFGNPGTLQGTVTDSGTGLPIPGVQVTAVHSAGYTFNTLTDSSGFYRRLVMEGTYHLTASKYGYLTETTSGVVIVEDMVTTQNFSLDPAPSYTVSGTVTDANTGWPLYASIAVEGAPIEPVWTDTVSGAYSVTLVAGLEYDLLVNAWVPGYHTDFRPVGPLDSDIVEDFSLGVDRITCVAPGYEQDIFPLFLDNFESGYGNWSMTGLWNPESQNDTCGSYIAPFPSPENAVYYADDTTCNYDVGNTAGSLSMISPVTVPSGEAIYLSFESYEQTECSGNCWYDKRYIEFSDDDGLTWTTIIEGYMEYSWNNYWLEISGFNSNDLTFRFRFDSLDSIDNYYYGWMVDDVTLTAVSCTPGAGSLVVGNVFDGNSGLGVNEATVTVEGATSVSTYATPDDPAVEDGFYTAFAPSGGQTVTASKSGYVDESAHLDIPLYETLQQDFTLQAGLLVVEPGSLEATLELGDTTTTTLTLTNEGSAGAAWEVFEADRGFVPVGGQGTTIAVPAGRSGAPEDSAASRGGHDLSPTPAWTYYDPNAHIAAGARVLIVHADDGDGEPLRSILQAYPDIEGVDVYDARTSTPSLTFLQGYDVVITWINYRFADRNAMGDVLADYVDGGNSVIQASFSWVDNYDWGMGGRFVTEYYSPFTSDNYGNHFDYASLGAYNAGHPIMQGVSAALDYYRDYVSLTVGAELVASWSDGEEFIATKGQVVAINSYTGIYYEWSGDIGIIFHNAVNYLMLGGDVPWLSEDPTSGTLPVMGTQVIDVTLDASAVEQPGDYLAHLRITNDTPYGPLAVPVTMHVTPPATYGKLAGTVTGLGLCDSDPAPLAGAMVHIEGSLGTIWDLETHLDGYYLVWMDESESPLAITVSMPEHEPGYAAGVIVAAGSTSIMNFDLRWLKPCFSTDPTSLESSLELGSTSTETFTLVNSGAGEGEFELVERDQGFSPLHHISIPASDGIFSRGKAQPSTGPAPTVSGSDDASMSADLPLAGAPAFAIDVYPGENLVYLPNTEIPGVWNIISYTSGYALFAGDFMYGDFSTLYVLDYYSNQLLSVNTSTGAITTIGYSTPYAGESWNGMSASLGGVMYASSSSIYRSTLYTIDLASGAATVVGQIINADCVIDIAITPDDTLYAVDICQDALYSVDTATGAGTLVGYIGFDANFAQGMDYEEKSGILYLAAFNNSLGQGELRIADTSTGNTVLVGAFPGGAETDALAFTTTAISDVPWLSEDSISGTLPADTSLDIEVTFDAGAVSQPGDYLADIIIMNNSPAGQFSLPVTMQVTPPAGWGKLEGTVTLLGYCDMNPLPLANAEVEVTGAGAGSWTLLTDADGYYTIWLDQAESPLTVHVETPEYEVGHATGVVITAGENTIADFDLRWLKPCLSTAPGSFEVEVLEGYSLSTTLSLINGGAAESTFELRERGVAAVSTLPVAQPVQQDFNLQAAPGGYQPQLTSSSFAGLSALGDTVAVFKDFDAWGSTGIESFLAANGITYEVHNSSEFGSLDFSKFGMIVVSSDQTQEFYDNYAAQVSKFEDYVADGGFLNFFACDGGWNGGMLNAPLPGGMTWNGMYYEDYNTIVDPAHPVVQGVPNPFYGSSASHGYFSNLPAEAHVIISGTSGGQPTTVEYPIGTGWLIAFGQTLEISHDYGWDAGLIMENTLLWGYEFLPDVEIPWLNEDPLSGNVQADSSLDVEVTFNSAGLALGTYYANLMVVNNNPLGGRITIPVVMHVISIEHGVTLFPTTAALSGKPGDTATYNVTITNTGNIEDTFTITLSGQTWVTVPSSTSVTLAPGASTTLQAQVTIPADAEDGDRDVATLNATSQGDPTKSASTTMTTTAVVAEVPLPTIYLPVILLRTVE